MPTIDITTPEGEAFAARGAVVYADGKRMTADDGVVAFNIEEGWYEREAPPTPEEMKRIQDWTDRLNDARRNLTAGSSRDLQESVDRWVEANPVPRPPRVRVMTTITIIFEPKRD